MNNRAFTISFVVAALAVSMVYSYVSSTEEAYRLQYGTEVPVVVAKKNIQELEILDDTNLAEINVPSTFKQPGTMGSRKAFFGALAVAPIMKDEQITRSKVTQLGTRTGLARQVAVGKRAVTISISDQTGVNKLIKPGDRVDVLTSTDPTGTGNKLNVEIRTILQDVLILATGKYVTNTVPGILEVDPAKSDRKTKVNFSEYHQFGSVTLEVDPYQAQMLVFAAKHSDIYLSLRNNDDNTKEDLTRVRMAEVMGKDGASAIAGAAQQQRAPASSSNTGTPTPRR